MSTRVTGWPLVPVLILPLCSAVRLAVWLTVRLCLQLCAKFLYCTMADGTFVAAAVCQIPLFSVPLPSELLHRGSLGSNSAAVHKEKGGLLTKMKYFKKS
jgi:hypothetical protein